MSYLYLSMTIYGTISKFITAIVCFLATLGIKMLQYDCSSEWNC